MGIGKVFVNNKPESNTLGGILPLSKGGTSSMNTDGAANQLTALDFDLRNAPNGVVGLNEQRKVCNELFTEETWDAAISIDGPVSVIVNSTNTYTIGRYSNFNEYVVSVNVGAVIINDDTIVFTAPSSPQTASLTVNGKSFPVDVVPNTNHVNTPNITSPNNGAINLGPSVVLTSSAFSVSSGSDVHEGSDWQAATDANFTNIVAAVTNSTSLKTSISLNDLPTNSTLYVRVKYKGVSMGYSNWSPVISFSTKVTYLPSTEEAILTASDKAAGDYFGYSVSMSSDGSRVAVGANLADPGGVADAGKAYIFTRSGTTWAQEAILTANDKATSDRFGISVSISSDGSRVAVGSQLADPDGIGEAGKAYIFTRSGTTWAQEAILTASDKATSDQFGVSVSLTGDGTRVAVGAYAADPGGVADAGKAYIFTRSGTTWAQEAILTANDKAASDQFGISVSISSDGSRVAVGSQLADPDGIGEAGKAYIFTRSGTTWAQEAILTASDKAVGDRFSWSVSMSSDGSRVAVGALFADPDGISAAGKAYIFTRSGTTWAQEAILTANDKLAGDRFGISVAISSDGSRVAIGAYLADPSNVSDAGKVYIFSRSGTTWTQEAVLTASDKVANDYFGYSVDISSDGSRVAIGAYLADPAGVANAGKAYIFS